MSHTSCTNCIKSYDIAVVGGGMVGSTLALLLARGLPELSIIVIEKGPGRAVPGDTLQRPSFDARSTALSYSSREIIETVGLWTTLSVFATPIKRVHVSEHGKFGGALMEAADHDLDALGYVVENRHFGSVLMQAVTEQANIDSCHEAEVTSVKMSQHCVELTAATPGQARESFECELLLVADGAQSQLRQTLGVSVAQHDYGQQAIVTNVLTKENHGCTAYERFTPNGPLAFLPLQAFDDMSRSAVIWTLPSELAQEVTALPADQFRERLGTVFGRRLGTIEAISERHSFPLQLVRAQEQVRQRVVIMGNAAHSLHPVAGQGFNLALRDCAVLTSVLQTGIRRDGQIGTLAVLKEYCEKQLWDQRATIGLSHWLPLLFSNKQQPKALLRNLGLAGINIFPGAREKFTKFAMRK